MSNGNKFWIEFVCGFVISFSITTAIITIVFSNRNIQIGESNV